MMYQTSVALCTYNGENYIEEQINSILHQTLLPDEIIVSDDGSSDQTVAIIREILEENGIKHKIFINETNLGVIKNFENAIKNCQGDIIFTADQDDVWVEEKVAKLVETFKENEQLNVIYTDAHLVNKDLSKKGIQLWDALHPGIKELKTTDETLKMLLKGNVMTGATMAFKRSLIEEILPFNQWWIHDYWIAITGALLGEVEAIAQPLILYRQHDTNVLGARKLDLHTKVRMYLRDFKQTNEISERQYQMMRELKKFVALHQEDISAEAKSLVNEAFLFWQENVALNASRKWTATRTIAANYKRGNYDKYYAGTKSAVRDWATNMFQ